jgi:hypothetical protein
MRLVLILLGMLLAQPALAAWASLGRSNQGQNDFTQYIDPETIRKTANGRRAWTMTSYEQTQTSPFAEYRSIKTLMEFDCTGERTRPLQVAFYSGPMGTGISVLSDDDPGRWSFESPGSVGETRLKVVCKRPLK